MSKNESKRKLIIRIACLALAALMVVSVAYTAIYLIVAALL